MGTTSLYAAPFLHQKWSNCYHSYDHGEPLHRSLINFKVHGLWSNWYLYGWNLPPPQEVPDSETVKFMFVSCYPHL